MLATCSESKEKKIVTGPENGTENFDQRRTGISRENWQGKHKQITVSCPGGVLPFLPLILFIFVLLIND